MELIVKLGVVGAAVVVAVVLAGVLLGVLGVLLVVVKGVLTGVLGVRSPLLGVDLLEDKISSLIFFHVSFISFFSSL